MKTPRVLICVVDNFGGMADVSRCYLEYFKGSSPENAGLLILREDTPSDVNADSENVCILETVNLNDENEQKLLKSQIDSFVTRFSPEVIVADAMTWRFFEKANVPLIADLHYLMARHNSLSRGNSVKKLFPDSLTKEEDLSLRHWLLEKQMNEKKFLRRASAVICNSQTTEKDLNEFLPHEISGKLSGIVPVKDLLGEVNFIPPSKREREFAYSGRFNTLKGVDHLGTIAKAFPAMMIRAYGIKKDLMSGFSQLLLNPKNLMLTPWISNPDELMTQLTRSRFHLFPSYYEPWGLSLQKSLASGAVCVANIKAGGHHEQIEHGKNGFLLDFDDSDFLERLREIVNKNDPELDKIASMNKKNISTSTGQYTDEILKFARKVAIHIS